MLALVTGGAGFIGSHLVDALVAEGNEVAVLDNLETGVKRNIEKHLRNSSFKFYHGSVTDKKAVMEAMKGAETVFHLAANLQGGGGVKDPLADFETNVAGTFNLLLAARELGVKRFVYASSVMVYGGRSELSQLPLKEDAPAKLITPYAASKFTGENYCSLFHRVYGMETVSLRYFNVYGPRVRPDNPYMGVVNKFISQCISGEQMIVYGDGTQTRDFVDVRDVVRATILASEKDAAGETINVGSGDATDINKLADLVYSCFKSGPKPVHGKPPTEDSQRNEYRHAQAGLEKAKRILGYEPKISIGNGIKYLVDFYISNAR